MISLNLKYTISEATSLEPYAIKAHILFKLKDENYRVQQITDNSVTFDDNPWKIMWRHEAARRLDRGKFEIEVSDSNIKTVKLTHYFSPWPLLTFVGFAIFCAIQVNDYTPIIFFGSFMTIVSIIQYYTLKNVGKEMLTSILQS